MVDGHVLQDRYRISRRIGDGGMGTVYLAHHLKLDRAVAIKTLRLDGDPSSQGSAREQFEQEARILAGLSHPSLARVTDFFEENDVGYLVMDYIDGKTLEQWVREEGRVSEPMALHWAAQLLDALAYLHGSTPPVIVRDLKPSNLLIDVDGRIRLIDFGIAKKLQEGQKTKTAIRSATSEGYAPLEQYGAGGTDQRSDLYSLGATLLFMLTGEQPPGAVERVTHNQQLPDPTTINLTVSSRCWQAMQRLMAISQSDRPADVVEARALLFSSQPVSHTARTELASGPLPPLPSPALPVVSSRPRAWKVAALFLGVILIGVTAIYLLKQHQMAQQEAAAAAEAERAREARQAADAAEAKRKADARSAYEGDATRALELLGKLDARTDIGINYREYNAQLAEVHYGLQEFGRKYGTSEFAGCLSFKAMTSAETSFETAAQAWKLKIDADSDDYHTREESENLLMSCWRTASTEVKRARDALDAHN
jgi:serine/threonine-protein kinase